MNVFVIPFSENELNDRLFGASPLIQERTVPLWRTLKNEGKAHKIVFHTIDLFDPETSTPDDILLVLNHPEESFWWRLYYLLKYPESKGGFIWKKRWLFYDTYKYFKRRILLQLEPPTATPTAYRILPKLAKLYTDRYFIVKDLGERFGYTHFIYDSYDRDAMIKKYSSRPKDKFFTMINANSAPHSLRHELYGERIKAAKFFSHYSDFDLYGPRWDLRPKHPFWWFRGDFIRKVWRGAVDDKWETLSRYKFALVFENCAYPGYVSEKIFDCLVTGVVPVYLGAPDIHMHVPNDCFIDTRNLSSYGELNDFLRGLTDEDIAMYRSAALDFLQKGKDRPFTKDFFVDRLLEILSPEIHMLKKGNPAPLVSVVVPTYNDSSYLKGAIESVLGQTYKKWELIVADDGSTDNTKSVVRSFSNKRIRYFYQGNKGLASARNLGLRHSKGKYIAFLDADDLFLPEKLERHVAYMEKHPECDLSYDELLFIRDEKPGRFWKVLIRHLSGFLKDEFIKIGGHCIGPSASFFRRELFKKYGGFPDGWRRNEDYYFNLKMAVNKVYFQHIEEAYTISRLRPQSLSRQGIHLKEAAELNFEIFKWLDRTLAKGDPARHYFPYFLSIARRRLALGYLILKDKKNGIGELKKWRYGWLFVPLFYILPAGLISFLITRLRSGRERFLYQEISLRRETRTPVLHRT